MTKVPKKVIDACNDRLAEKDEAYVGRLHWTKMDIRQLRERGNDAWNDAKLAIAIDDRKKSKKKIADMINFLWMIYLKLDDGGDKNAN
jgi:hypothetical protein